MDGALVKGSSKSENINKLTIFSTSNIVIVDCCYSGCFLIEDGKRRPFGGLQAFINRGFDFDEVNCCNF